MVRTDRYTATAIAFHWIVAALIITNVCLIWTVDLWPDSFVRPVIDTHKSIGITVLGLAIMRVLWRLSHRPPELPANYPRWERLGAHAAHGLLYLLIFCLPLSGWAHDSAWSAAASHPMYLYGLIPWPRIGWLLDIPAADKDFWHDRLGQVHAAFGYVLYGLLFLHVAGALKHQLIDKEPELQRMLP